MRIHPHNENLESPRPRHLSFKQLCNVLRGGGGCGEGDRRCTWVGSGRGMCCPGSTGTTSFIQNESSFLEVKAYEIL